MRRDIGYLLITIIVVVALTGYFASSIGYNSAMSTIGAQQADITQPGRPTPGVVSAFDCPTDKDTVLTLNIQNKLNESAIEIYDAEVTFENDGKKTIGTDGTGGEYTLDCGITYKLTVESADGASGDNSRIIEILEGSGVLNSDGTVSFTTSGSSQILTVDVPQHATLEFKMYDNEDRRNAFDTGDTTSSDWEATGVTYTDGDNTTSFALTNDGDSLDFDISIRAIQVDTEFSDNYLIIAIEAPVTEYDEPVLSFNGQELVDVKGSLTPDENKLTSSYEYVYKITNAQMTHRTDTLDFYIEANSDASTNIDIDMWAAGKVDSIKQSGKILTSAALDNSGATAVYTVQGINIQVS